MDRVPGIAIDGSRARKHWNGFVLASKYESAEPSRLVLAVRPEVGSCISIEASLKAESRPMIL